MVLSDICDGMINCLNLVPIFFSTFFVIKTSLTFLWLTGKDFYVITKWSWKSAYDYVTGYFQILTSGQIRRILVYAISVWTFISQLMDEPGNKRRSGFSTWKYCLTLLTELVCRLVTMCSASVSHVAIQSLSLVRLFATPWTAARQASLSTINSQSLSKLMFTESVMTSNQLILWCPLLHLSSHFSSIRVFSNESVLHIWRPKNWVSASASVLPMNIQGWFPLGRTAWTSLLSKNSQVSSPTPQFKSIISLALSFLHSPTFTSIHVYWENHSFDKTDLFGKVMSLLFNMLSRLFMAFLPRSNLLLISWLPSSSTVILEPKK